MVVPESGMNTQNEVESPLQLDQHSNKNQFPFSSLGRQNSIYSLTLDEFQHTLWESGKNFGSMNMDEFLSSIWNAEENQVMNNSNVVINNNNNNNMNNLSLSEASTDKGLIRKQPSLPRQGSLTLPAPLCRKTVDEVWSEIHKGQQENNNNNNCGSVGNTNNAPNTESAPCQPTFGEMTLEDFLIKAGVVREHCAMPLQPQPHHHMQQYAMYPNAMGPSFSGGGAIGEPSGYSAAATMPPPGVCFGGRGVNGGGGYAAAVAATNMGMAAPVSPVSPEGIGTGENSGGQFGVEMVVFRGRKRVLDGPVEKVVERRQRRMIKNRESAARSRARKHAYTVELEAELNQLKEENAQLKLAVADLERRRKQQNLEEVNGSVQTNAQKAKRKLASLRRTQSCPL
uniref:Protein ABSCISIC ACID-INSENSITIVE 5 n=1 Tax=Cajanus cajan TaxID=3821 RepID=A0A151RE21_CAJCA|nr:Protein ABSCISIC ACID-INSENSITIVE 5 [Cajanus cajan]